MTAIPAVVHITVWSRSRFLVEQVVGDALALLDSQPIPPGEYDCVCDPSTTGMIVHEAFGHGRKPSSTLAIISSGVQSPPWK